MMATYIVQKKESFTRNLEAKPVRMCGVSILTNQEVVVSYQLFNCFGIHSLFEIVVMISFYLILRNVPGTL